MEAAAETTKKKKKMPKPKPVWRGKTGVADYIIHAILILLTLCTIFPFYNVILMSFSDSVAISKQVVYLIPTTFDFSAYTYIFQESRFLNALLVTIFVTVVGTLINMFVTVTGAYALSKSGYPGRKFFYVNDYLHDVFQRRTDSILPDDENYGLVNNLFVMVLPVAINTSS